MHSAATAPDAPCQAQAARWPHWFFPLAAAIQAALFAAVLVRAAILRPYGDTISWLAAYLQARQDGHWFAYLWTPHNEHRLALIRVLTALSVSGFHANGLPFVLAATTAMVLTAWIAFAEFRRISLASSCQNLAWLAPMLCLNSAFVVACGIPMNTVYPLTLLFIVAAFALSEHAAERAPWLRAAAVGCALVASLANAVGLVAWPALLWSAWRRRPQPVWILSIAAAAGLYTALYIYGVPPVAVGPAHPLTAGQAAKMANYLLAYIGLPFSRIPGFGVPGRLFGAVLLCASLAALACEAASPRPSSRLHRFAGFLLMTGLGGAILATIGRVNVSPDVNVPIRYAILVTPIHLGLLALVLPRHAAGANPRHLAICATFAVLLLAWQVASGRAVVAASDAVKSTLDRYESGIREPGMTHVIFPDLRMADRVLAATRALAH